LKGVQFVFGRLVLGTVTAGFCSALPTWHRVCLDNGELRAAEVMQTAHNWRDKEKKARGIDAGTGNGNRELVVVARNDRIA
jgi:hypothetical protein